MSDGSFLVIFGLLISGWQLAIIFNVKGYREGATRRMVRAGQLSGRVMFLGGRPRHLYGSAFRAFAAFGLMTMAIMFLAIGILLVVVGISYMIQGDSLAAELTDCEWWPI